MKAVDWRRKHQWAFQSKLRGWQSIFSFLFFSFRFFSFLFISFHFIAFLLQTVQKSRKLLDIVTQDALHEISHRQIQNLIRTEIYLEKGRQLGQLCSLDCSLPAGGGGRGGNTGPGGAVFWQGNCDFAASSLDCRCCRGLRTKGPNWCFGVGGGCGFALSSCVGGGGKLCLNPRIVNILKKVTPVQ